jgi:hypothetical protein
MSERNDKAIAADGYGLAGFLLIINSLSSQVRSGQLSKPEVIEIIGKSRSFLASFPGDPKVAAFAGDSLKLAETLLSASLAQTPSEGLN